MIVAPEGKSLISRVLNLFESIFETRLFLFLLCLVTYSCHKPAKPNQSNFPELLFTAVNFVGPSKDSIKPPEIEVYDERKYQKYPVTGKRIYQRDESVFTAGNGSKLEISCKRPEVLMNFKDNHFFTLQSKGIRFPGVIPEVTLAKDMAHTASNQLGISYFGKVQGLKHDYVCKMISDQTGHIWMATRGGGVCRYDGKYFTHFTDKQGLASNDIWALLEDRNGNIWMGSSNNGVTRYEGNQENTLCSSKRCNHVLSNQYDREAHQKKVSHAMTFFDEKSGLISNAIRNFFEDKQGRIWISTDKGISVYDGHTFTNIASEVFALGQNISVLQDSENYIWIFSQNGIVVRLDYDKLNRPCMQSKCKHQSSVQSEASFHTGALLKSSVCMQISAGSVFYDIADAVLDSKNNFWLATEFGLIKLDNSYLDNPCFTNACIHNHKETDELHNHNMELSKHFKLYTTADGLSHNYLLSVFEDSKGNIWTCSYGGGVNRFDGKSFQHITTKQGLSTNEAFTILEDRIGNIWIGGRTGGACKYIGSHLSHYLSFSGEEKFIVNQLTPDSTGRLWLSTETGALCYFEKNKFTEHIPRNYPHTNKVLQTLIDKKGIVWQATWANGFRKFDGKYLTQVTDLFGVEKARLFGLTKDAEDNIWFNQWEKGSVRFDGKVLMCLSTAQGMSDHRPICSALDRNGSVWFGMFNGSISVIKPKHPQSACNKQACIHNPNKVDDLIEHLNNINYDIRILHNPYVHSAPVSCIESDREGKVWIGTQGQGLRCIDGTKEFRLTSAHGLVDDYVSAIREDIHGDIWIGTGNGVSHLKRKVLNMYLKPDASLKSLLPMFENYTYADGFLGLSCNRGAISAEAKDKIWIGCSDRLTVIAMDRIITDTTLPVVRITGLDLFNEQTDWLKMASNSQQPLVQSNGIEIKNVFFSKLFRWDNVPDNPSLPHDNNYVSLRYIAVSTYKPQQIRYRYMLSGLDKNWNNLTDKTEANYGNLPPGNYIFKVFAVNSDGKQGKVMSYPFTIRPPWWATWWAYTAYFVCVLSAAILYIRSRERSLLARQKELENKIDEATSEIRNQKAVVELEKQRSEELLLNILPEEVAEELKLNGKTEPKQMDEVTVLFSDFKGFTEISSLLKPKELVNEIHECFSAFDQIMQNHGVEKIKTIGDAYMAAGGIPVVNKTHAIDTVSAALELQEFMQAYRKVKERQNEMYFEIRIGIHSGPVVSGIVGVKKFAFDIWGDTVNIASRMESSGEVGKVNISGSTYELIKDHFNCLYRGKIPIKGKGEVDMYFVESRKA